MSFLKKITVILLLSMTVFNLFGIAFFASEECAPVIYRDFLISQETDVYDTFLKNSERMKDGNSAVKIYLKENIQKEEIGKTLQRASAAFVLDHPECFWISPQGSPDLSLQERLLYRQLSWIQTTSRPRPHFLHFPSYRKG